MIIDVLPPSRSDPKSLSSQFALKRDDWNDYSFQTYYHLYYQNTDELQPVTYIGGVKILRSGQTSKDSQFIRDSFKQLGPEFCSVGNTLDYYQRLNELPADDRNAIMDALNDAVAHPELVDLFSHEEGWTVSVFRDTSDWRTFLDDARVMYRGSYGTLSDLETVFSFFPKNSDDELVLSFTAPSALPFQSDWLYGTSGRKRSILPDRTIVLIGRNGSGKSTLLSRLAHMAFASPQERATKRLREMGRLEPASIGFTRVITVSYSAFDSFTVPGAATSDRSQTIRDLETDGGRFIFCGLRDLAAEAKEDLARTTESEGLSNNSGGFDAERQGSTRLKPVDALADEFTRLLKRIQETGLKDRLLTALEPLLGDPSFMDLNEQIADLFSSQSRHMFLGWSTGHKIVLHVIASLVAHAQPRSLVLFDEPEMHLHPPLMAALMHSVRIVLADTNALCVVATHSPVLLQETLARHVRQVSRVGDKLTIKRPALETFGENIGLLTYSTFGLTASATDYHKILDVLIEAHDAVETIDELFTPGLSSQARAYIMAGLAAKQSGQ